MTTILFKDDKFWIEGVEVINPEKLKIYYVSNNTFEKTYYKGSFPNGTKLKPGDTFPLPENLSYEIACNYDCCIEDGACEHCQKPVIRLKLKELKNETPEADKKEYEKTLNKLLDFLPGQSNSSPEALVEKPDFEVISEEWSKRSCIYRQDLTEHYKAAYHAWALVTWKTYIEPLNSKIQSLQKENEEWKSMEFASNLLIGEKVSKISDLEAQLVKAKEIINSILELAKCGYHHNYPRGNSTLYNRIENAKSFLSTNEVKEQSPEQESGQQ